jgi:hypothetical protein
VNHYLTSRQYVEGRNSDVAEVDVQACRIALLGPELQPEPTSPTITNAGIAVESGKVEESAKRLRFGRVYGFRNIQVRDEMRDELRDKMR